MPRLMLLVACEKALVDRGTNTLSLISLLQVMHIPAADLAGPETTAVTDWSIVAIWATEPGDEAPREWEASLSLTMPDGTVAAEVIGKMDLSKLYHRRIHRIGGFPAAQQGVSTLRAKQREVGTEAWIEVGAYPIRVQHTHADAP